MQSRVQLLGMWRKVRRYAVPSNMIQAATERRLAGDFVGAARAARAHLGFDLAELTRSHGAEFGRGLHSVLLDFAPDLLRWHLPRVGDALAPRRKLLIWTWHTGAEALELWVETPKTRTSPQDIHLQVGRASGAQTLPRYCWSVRHAGELLIRAGGQRRLPFFTRAGQPFGFSLGGAGTPEFDLEPEAHFEAVTRIQDRPGGFVEAAARCGFEASGLKNSYLPETSSALALPHLLSQARLARGVTNAQHAYLKLPDSSQALWIRALDAEAPRLELASRHSSAQILQKESAIELAFDACRRFPDLDLLRLHLIRPAELHPLVARALFPDLPETPPVEGPPLPRPLEPFRVRCRKDWHWVGFSEGRLQALQHTQAEADQEAVLGALGAPLPGCFQALEAWRRGGRGPRVPKLLRLHRSEFGARVFHGDARGALAMLEQDPSLAKRGDGRSLLHDLPWLGVELLPELLAQGLKLDAPDALGRTPVQVALAEGCTEVASELIAAVARPPEPEKSKP